MTLDTVPSPWQHCSLNYDIGYCSLPGSIAVCLAALHGLFGSIAHPCSSIEQSPQQDFSLPSIIAQSPGQHCTASPTPFHNLHSSIAWSPWQYCNVSPAALYSLPGSIAQSSRHHSSLSGSIAESPREHCTISLAALYNLPSSIAVSLTALYSLCGNIASLFSNTAQSPW